MNQISMTWAELKSVKSVLGSSFGYVDLGSTYVVFLVDVVAIVMYVADVSATGDVSEFEATYKATSTVHSDLVRGSAAKLIADIPKARSRGMIPFSSLLLSDRSKKIFTSINFADRTTWWYDALQVTGQSLTNGGVGLTFTSPHQNWINAGAMFAIDQTKAAKVYVNGALQTTGFTINYSAGSITFASQPAGAVTADYWHSGSAVYEVVPNPGKKVELSRTELQISKGAAFNGNQFIFQIIMGSTPTVVDERRYRSVVDLVNESNVGMDLYPAGFGGLVQDLLVIPWDYLTSTIFKSSLSMKLRLSLLNNVPLSGVEIATVSFYTVSDSE